MVLWLLHICPLFLGVTCARFSPPHCHKRGVTNGSAYRWNLRFADRDRLHGPGWRPRSAPPHVPARSEPATGDWCALRIACAHLRLILDEAARLVRFQIIAQRITLSWDSVREPASNARRSLSIWRS